MLTANKKVTVQGFIKSLLAFSIIFSTCKPLILTAYLVLVYTFLDIFNYIGNKEAMIEINTEEKPSSTTKAGNDDDKHFWPQTITFVIFQLLSLLAVFGLTWYVFVKKMGVF
jgi:hypothetical protein